MSLDIVPADIPAAFAPEMAAACSDALSEGKCVLASTLPESAQPDAVALVLWRDGDYHEVTVRVGRGNGQWVVRALAFAEADSVQERWVTVGLTIATLVGESQSAQPRKPPPPALPEPPPAPKRAAFTPREPRRFDLALGVLSGPGWNQGGPQLGAWLSGGVSLPTMPFAFQAFGSYAQSAGPEIGGINLRTSWLTAGLSGAAQGTVRALNLKASAGLELAFRRVQAELSGEDASDQELPVRARVFASYPAEGGAAFTAGAIVRIPPFASEESDAHRVRGPSFPLELLAGLRVQL